MNSLIPFISHFIFVIESTGISISPLAIYGKTYYLNSAIKFLLKSSGLDLLKYILYSTLMLYLLNLFFYAIKNLN